MSVDEIPSAERWGRFRFEVIGHLLASPPEKGELRREIERLAAREWTHPMSGERVRFGVSTIERWYYAALASNDPVGELRRHVRSDAGQHLSMTEEARRLARELFEAHHSWSYKLHFENLVAAAAEKGITALPSYSTVLRWRKSQGLFKQRRRPRAKTEAAQEALERLETREVRSYEVEHVHGLWHADFHVGSRKVLTPEGRWESAFLFCTIDDRSRLVCHAQWYLAETAQAYVHGLCQALQKRGLPRAFMHDNGSPMRAAETQEGLGGLSITEEPTLAYSPYQNAKQENFFAVVEGRLMPMLEGVEELTLELLNDATQPWVEYDHNQAFHQEIGTTPLARFLEGPSVGRPCPSSEELRRLFRRRVGRTQRRSDGTVCVEGRRFEVPSRYRHLERLWVRYARWDLSRIDLVDARTDEVVCPLYPQDKAANADGRRRRLEAVAGGDESSGASASELGREIAPLLRQYMADYAATGLPPAYLPMAKPREGGEDEPGGRDEGDGEEVELR